MTLHYLVKYFAASTFLSWLVAGCSHHPLQLDQRKKGPTIAVQRNAEALRTADVAVTEAN